MVEIKASERQQYCLYIKETSFVNTFAAASVQARNSPVRPGNMRADEPEASSSSGGADGEAPAMGEGAPGRQELARSAGAQWNNHRNISELLDNLLSGYDNSVRPDFGGPPAIVEVDIMVRSMGPISEVDMTYSMDCYFRQSWVDRRLAFTGGSKETLALSISMLARIWKPDTYFYNGKQSYLHTITTPNKFVRLYRDGRVLYSSRLTIKAGCPMNLEDFPMDTQRCPLKFGSFGYTTTDVVYRWNRQRTVAIAEDMKLSQFDLIATPSANQTDVLKSQDSLESEYSMLLVSFHLQRHMGNFLIQVYGPCVLLVVLSWVSFWLNREATADRVSLGITTVLTMTFLGLEARTDLPKVPYPTALDFFVFLSFAFIFATIIQFAVVHYFTKYGSGECYFSSDLSSVSSSDDEDEDTWSARRRRTIELPGEPGSVAPVGRKASSGSVGGVGGRGGSFLRRLQAAATPQPSSSSSADSARFVEVIPLSELRVLPASARRRPSAWSHQQLQQPHACRSAPRKKRRTPRFNSVSKIDRASRIVFPLCFLAINMFYWYSYLWRSRRLYHVRASGDAAAS
ncbi:gamma-aminobutyric acid receptor alpha-like [Schistocerca americana]|uniref:gamma-aminobutyric acid receptor alpha-like n=1 Tax=Schistocerca americana TaxID=7009 RepID=UPI001F500BDD|nr:gamma-aminobutyric acid receptor alpha-like [Schistocerca americana]